MMSRKNGMAVCLILAALAPLGCQKAGAPQAASELPTIKTQSGGELVTIPAGFFEMGSRYGRDEEKPVHKVWIDSFLMDRHEVTQAEYEKLGKIEAFPNPSHFQGADLPVEQVTWPQAARFCNARSRFEGLQPCYNEDTGACDFEANGYRLPTEAEWEYACRAGTNSDYSFGERTAAARRLRLVRRQLRQEDSSRRPEEAESVGPLRHARQRGRVVPGCLRPGLLQGQPGEEPARTGRRQRICPPRRLMEIPRRRLAVGLPDRRDPRLLRRLPGPRCHRLPLRAQGAALEGCRIIQTYLASSFRGNHALPHLGLLRLLPDRLPRLPPRPPKQPVDEHLVDDRLVHVLRLVESLVPPAALRHLGDRLPHGPLDGTEPADAHVLARDQPGQQFRLPRLLQILRVHHREPQHVPRTSRVSPRSCPTRSRTPTPCSRSWAFRRTTSSPR